MEIINDVHGYLIRNAKFVMRNWRFALYYCLLPLAYCLFLIFGFNNDSAGGVENDQQVEQPGDSSKQRSEFEILVERLTDLVERVVVLLILFCQTVSAEVCVFQFSMVVDHVPRGDRRSHKPIE